MFSRTLYGCTNQETLSKITMTNVAMKKFTTILVGRLRGPDRRLRHFLGGDPHFTASVSLRGTLLADVAVGSPVSSGTLKRRLEFQKFELTDCKPCYAVSSSRRPPRNFRGPSSSEVQVEDELTRDSPSLHAALSRARLGRYEDVVKFPFSKHCDVHRFHSICTVNNSSVCE